MFMRLLLILCIFVYCLQAAAGGLSSVRDTRVMDQQQATLRYSGKNLDRSSGDKFLLFEVIEVINPQAIPLNFLVHYQKPGKEKIYLGSFALYPADNPGQFIVATRGIVSDEGEVLLSLSPESPADTVRLSIGPVRLVDQLKSPDQNHVLP